MDPARFATDISLAKFGRWLRFLGYDVEVLGGARLEELFAHAGRTGRIALTMSLKRPRAAFVEVARVERGNEAASLRRLVARYAPLGRPFSRCVECNTALATRHAMEAVGEVPSRVLRGAPTLSYCPVCGKWYWEGSHVDRVRRALETMLERPLEPRNSDAAS